MESTAEKINGEPAPEEELAPGTLPPAPIAVEKADKLEAEVLSLKLMNAVNRETILQQQMVQLQQQMREVQREKQGYTEAMTAMRHHLESKYNINLNTHMIMPNGLVVARAEVPKASSVLKHLTSE